MTKQGSVGILMSYESYCRVERERDEARALVQDCARLILDTILPLTAPWTFPEAAELRDRLVALPWLAKESQPAEDEGQPPASLGKSIGGTEP